MATKKAMPPEEQTVESTPTPEPRLFTVIRNFDETGISGQGRVLDGVIWHNGRVSIMWRSDLAESNSKHGQLTRSDFDSMKGFLLVHVESHEENKTEVIYGNTAWEYPTAEELKEAQAKPKPKAKTKKKGK